MLRIIMLSTAMCAIVLLSLFSVLWIANDGSKSRVIEERGEILKLDSINVPVIVDSQVTGYVIAQLSFLFDPDKAKRLPIPLEIFVAGETYAFLYDRRGQDALKRNASHLGKAMDELRSTINARYSIDAVRAIEVKQLDFLTKDEIRNMQLRKGAS